MGAVQGEVLIAVHRLRITLRYETVDLEGPAG